MKYPTAQEMSENVDELQVTEIPTKPSKLHTGTKPHTDRGNHGPYPTGTENADFLLHELTVAQLPPIDVDDPDQVQHRIEEYFSICIDNNKKPTVNGLANALGVTRVTLQKWGEGQIKSKDPLIVEMIRGAYSVMASLWEDYMGNGKINPVSGIFLGKNHFQYVDKQEVELQPKNPLGEITSAEEIRGKYIESVDTPLLEE